MSSAEHEHRARPGLLPEGKYWDRLRRGTGPLIDFGWRSNVVVDSCRDLLATFMLGGAALGIQKLALGRGDASWDLAPPPLPGAGTAALVDAAPVIVNVGDAALALALLDASGAPSPGPSPRLQITLELAGSALPISGDETFPLREFALFGELAGADCMIDYVRHPVMHLGSDDSLSRRIRLMF
jgi:hypothetical protein